MILTIKINQTLSIIQNAKRRVQKPKNFICRR